MHGSGPIEMLAREMTVELQTAAADLPEGIHTISAKGVDFTITQDRPADDIFTGEPGTKFFLTRKLWDVGNTDPYGHRGDLTTTTEAILYQGGEARASPDAFAAADVAD
jgi:hypothetical protein